MEGLDAADDEFDSSQYRVLVESVGDPMYVLDDEGVITFANAAMARTLECDREEVIGSHVSRFVADADARKGTEALLSLVDGDEEWASLEMEVRTADGRRIHTEDKFAALTEDGSLVGSVGVVRDITDRTERQRELEELNHTIERLHGVATELQATETVDAIYELAIAAAEDVLGFDWCVVATVEEEWFELRAVSEEAPVGDGERHLRVDEGLAGESFRTGESRLSHDGRYSPTSEPAREVFRSSITVPLGDRGVFQALSRSVGHFDQQDVEVAELLVTDVAEALRRVERERELARQNERLERFASMVSHDLRNPLQVAKGYVELLDCEGPVDAVADALDRMDVLIGESLALARQGQTIDDPEPVDLRQSVETAWETVETVEADLVVHDDFTFLADGRRLSSLLKNLVRNAVEHGDAATVRVGSLDDGEGFYVEDDGVGVPPDERGQVFEFGYSTAEEGTGVGLAIVAEIADAHGWDVAVAGTDASDGDEGGARFEFSGVRPVDR
ncbi:histidine kinase [Halobacteriales archaeon QS_1_68_20]|nr:MAG: histidine kinase [Halobacteriales archaeon QS_1_68_20]